MSLEYLEKYASPLIRITMSLVFLYFGYRQITDPVTWTGFVPSGVLIFGITAYQAVIMNALLELSFGFLLLIGLYTRFVAFILALHLFGIAFSIGLNDLGIRDFGLAFATLSVFLRGSDEWCLDQKWK